MSRLDRVEQLLREARDMAPFPWRYTERMRSKRIEDANGNAIIDFAPNDAHLQGTPEDLDRLARAIGELADLVPVVRAAMDYFTIVGAGAEYRAGGVIAREHVAAARGFADALASFNLRDPALELACPTCQTRPCRCNP